MDTIELSAYSPAKLAAELKASPSIMTTDLAAGKVPDAEHFVVVNGNSAALQEWADLNAMDVFPAPEFDDERKNANQDRGQEKGAWPCPVCGKSVNLKTAKWVHMTNGGDYWNMNLDPSVTNHDTMGGFPVGSDCAKKFPPAFVMKNPEWSAIA